MYKQMKNNLWILCVCVAFHTTAQKKERVLFVGNSFTFYYNIPTTVEQMANERGLGWKVNQSTAGGATLKQHWEGKKQLKTKRILKRKRFSRIVFQDHSTYPITAIDTTVKYLKLLQSTAKVAPKHYLYATWAYPGIPGNISNSLPIEKALKEKAMDSPSTLVPVGRAFDRFKAMYPEIPLLTADDKHPSPNGSYLAACVLFAQLSGQSTKGLERRAVSKQRKGKQLYYYIVETDVAKKCQRIADEIVLGITLE